MTPGLGSQAAWLGAFASACLYESAQRAITYTGADNLGATEVQHSAAQVEADIADFDFDTALDLLQGLDLQ